MGGTQSQPQLRSSLLPAPQTVEGASPALHKAPGERQPIYRGRWRLGEEQVTGGTGAIHVCSSSSVTPGESLPLRHTLETGQVRTSDMVPGLRTSARYECGM